MSLGSYNNTEPGSNPFRGAIDEVALYAQKLTPAQILAHYQNATNVNRATPYDVLIKSDGPVGYWRLDDPLPGPDVAINMGLLQNAGAASNTAPIKHPGTGALAGETDGSYSFHWQDGGGTTADIPWNAQNNPDASVPFTLEAWLRPTADRMNPGPSPLNNRYTSSGTRQRIMRRWC